MGTEHSIARPECINPQKAGTHLIFLSLKFFSFFSSAVLFSFPLLLVELFVVLLLLSRRRPLEIGAIWLELLRTNEAFRSAMAAAADGAMCLFLFIIILLIEIWLK
jgi:hypothetical protein